MQITVEQKMSSAVGDFGATQAQIALRLEGRKKWIAHNRLSFETSQSNISLLLSLFPAGVVEDRRLSDSDAKLLGEIESPSSTTAAPAFVLPPHNYQRENFERFKDQAQWAIFSEQGTGKTKVAFDIISHRFLKGTLTGVLVLSSPKGVHAQWVETQMVRHLWRSVKVLPYIWEGKKDPAWLGKATPELQIVSGNIDMLKGKGYEMLEKFVAAHKGKLLVLVDESDSIANVSSLRSKKLRKLAEVTQQRAIMTGTPIAKDLTDEWSQFYFLNPDIIGHKYLTSFRAQFCIMGGFEGKSVIGHRNVEQFKKITAPYIFRATKAELDLPEKVYDEVVFDLHPEQKRMIKDLRKQFFASLDSGATVAVKNGATAMIRIQQISNGFAVDEDGQVTKVANPRLDALKDLRRQINGPTIIWCRFKHDVHLLKGVFPNAVTIFGEDKQDDRIRAKAQFMSGEATELLATAGAAGKGVDGLQEVCSDAIYYSNSFSSIDRWQSEDRIHRIGMKGTATYFDLIARGSIDRAILGNLQRKKQLSMFVLDDIKQIMETIE